MIATVTGPVELLDAFVASWAHDRRIGYKLECCGGKFPPLTHNQAEAIREHAFELYWTARLEAGSLDRCKECLRAIGAGLAAAMAEYRAGKGKPGRTERLRAALRERDGDKCWICGTDVAGADGTIEHKVALANGGTWAFGNLALAHEQCNKSLGRLPLAAKEAARSAITKEHEG